MTLNDFEGQFSCSKTFLPPISRKYSVYYLRYV